MIRLLSLLSCFVVSCATVSTLEISSHEEHKKEITAFQNKMNQEYKDSLESPLKEEDRLVFSALEYFDINPEFRVPATFKKQSSEVFKMKTTTDRAPEYRKYGVLSFKLSGKKYKLNLYQNIKLIEKEKYKDYLFLPFTDASNGNESYGGGRYIDLKIPEGNEVLIDFNKAYNPYCAYNSKYSCPIPPAENDVDIKIMAGVKLWEKH